VVFKNSLLTTSRIPDHLTSKHQPSDTTQTPIYHSSSCLLHQVRDHEERLMYTFAAPMQTAPTCFPGCRTYRMKLHDVKVGGEV
jgi:hypothetical protein